MSDNAALRLLGVMARASSWLNILKYSKDRKQRKQAIGSLIAAAIVWVMMVVYAGAYAMGLVSFGMGERIPAFTAVAIFAMSFFLTLLRAGGYLFGFKDYDMLMAMPFNAKDIVGSKFLLMYLKSTFWTWSLPLAMLVGYGMSGNLTVARVIMWVVMTPFLPLIPMIIATGISILITMIGARSEHKTIIRTILTMIIVVPLSFSGAIIGNYTEKVGTAQMLNGVSGTMDNMVAFIPGANWFAKAIVNNDLISMILLVVVSLVLYELFFLAASRYYRQINSRLNEGSVHKEVKAYDYRKRDIVVSIAMKEWKRMASSTTYMVNAFLSEIFAILMGIAVLFVDPDTIISPIINEMPINVSMIYALIPFVVYFMLGMVSTTAISPSVEGKSWWIIRSLPISVRDDCKGKALFNLWLAIPVGIFAVTAISMRLDAGLAWTLLNNVMIIALVLFSTCYGLFCGIRFRRLDWTSEVEVIKQGPAVMWYLFPNIIVTMMLIGAVIVLGTTIDPSLIELIMIPLIMLLSFLFWKLAVRTAESI